ncbi:MAG: LysR family transcriptional regulator [Clostridium sp.]
MYEDQPDGIFSCVCRCGSITKAAKELHISQPSVTAAVHELEKELGVNLFLRRNNKIQLTEEGWFVQERIDGILKSMDTLNRDLNDFVGQKNHIRLGVPLQIGSFLLPLCLANSGGNIRISVWRLKRASAIDIVKKLLDDQLDLRPFCRWTPLASRMWSGRICTIQSFVSVSQRIMKLAKKESVSFRERYSCPLVVISGRVLHQRAGQQLMKRRDRCTGYLDGDQPAACHQKIW